MLKLCLCFRRLLHRKQYNQVQSVSHANAVEPAGSHSAVPSDQRTPQLNQGESTRPPALRKKSSGVYVFNKDKVTLLEQPTPTKSFQEAPVFVTEDKVSSVRKRLASF